MKRTIFVLCVLTIYSGKSQAQDQVPWRSDYHAARREALGKQRPLFIVFSTDWCIPCKRLDAVTFRHQQIINVLANHFIPLKLNGDRESALADALRIEGYPTLLIADEQGNIRQRLSGFVPVERLLPDLQRAIPTGRQNLQVDAALEVASSAFKKGQTADAVTHLKSILDGQFSSADRGRAQRFLDEIETYGRQLLLHAQQRIQHADYSGAESIYVHVQNQYAGLPVAGESANQLRSLHALPEVVLQKRRTHAAALLTQARQDLENKLYMCSLERCQLLQTAYNDLPEATEATKLIDRLRGDSEQMLAMEKAAAEHLATVLQIRAQALLDRGEADLAVALLERIVSAAPDSPQAAAAKKKLVSLQFKPHAPYQTTTAPAERR